MESLHESQLKALTYVRSNALTMQDATLDETAKVLQAAGLSMQQYTNALNAIQINAPIDVSFHPDRPTARGMTVVSGLLSSGEYKSQFETGISNGGLTAYAGGDRDRWERRLFGGAYQEPGVTAADRPKYGALNLMNHWDGACPRFGSCYFRLNSSVARRCSFAYGDSSTSPSDTAVMDRFDVVLAKLIAEVFYNHAALGMEELRLDAVLENLAKGDFSHQPGAPTYPPGRSLDDCIEVHVHGRIDLALDVEWLAVDQSFHATPCGHQLSELARRFGFPIRWNPRFDMVTDQVPNDFRGSVMVPLASHIAPDGVLNAAKIGVAVEALNRCPGDWERWGTFAETLQYLKQIWHVLVAYGEVRRGS